MLPKIILHNTISLNGIASGFSIDMDLHYKLACAFNPDAILMGSDTLLTSQKEVPAETEEDLRRPNQYPNDKRPWLVVVDSRGILVDLLHIVRRLDYIKDVMVLISDTTPPAYIQYLTQRNYEYIQVGSDKVEYSQALNRLNIQYGVNTIVTDSGGTLNAVLLQNNLADEISLVVAPVLISLSFNYLFRKLNSSFVIKSETNLKLKSVTTIENDNIHLVYSVVK